MLVSNQILGDCSFPLKNRGRRNLKQVILKSAAVIVIKLQYFVKSQQLAENSTKEDEERMSGLIATSPSIEVGGAPSRCLLIYARWCLKASSGITYVNRR